MFNPKERLEHILLWLKENGGMLIEYLVEHDITREEYEVLIGSDDECLRLGQLIVLCEERNLVYRGLSGGKTDGFFVGSLLKNWHGYKSEGRERVKDDLDKRIRELKGREQKEVERVIEEEGE